MNFEQARIDMIEQQIRTWDVNNPQVLSLMRELPREIFIPKDYKEFSYADMQVPLAHEQVMLPPREIGRILQVLAPKSDEKVLEIGTGSGYLTTLFSKMVNSVISVEIFPDIAEAAQKCWQRLHIQNIQGLVGDAANGWEPLQEFDLICITASLPQEIDLWRQQLSIGGRLFVVLGAAPIMHATLITRTAHHDWQHQVIYDTLVPALIGTEMKKTFNFNHEN